MGHMLCCAFEHVCLTTVQTPYNKALGLISSSSGNELYGLRTAQVRKHVRYVRGARHMHRPYDSLEACPSKPTPCSPTPMPLSIPLSTLIHYAVCLFFPAYPYPSRQTLLPNPHLHALPTHRYYTLQCVLSGLWESHLLELAS